MKREAMEAMSDSDLAMYAGRLGIDAGGKERAALIDEIEARRAERAKLNLIGVDVEVPIRKMHDKKTLDLINSSPMTDLKADKVMLALLGKEQVAKIRAAATDEDGVVDTDAYYLAFWALVSSDALKKY